MKTELQICTSKLTSSGESLTPIRCPMAYVDHPLSKCIFILWLKFYTLKKILPFIYR
jgi:hypothetical protein